jgi:CheY-like chemotaxis protein
VTSELRNGALLVSQIFLATMSVTTLTTAVLVSERSGRPWPPGPPPPRRRQPGQDEFRRCSGTSCATRWAIASAVRVLEVVENHADRAVTARAIVVRQVDRLARMVDDLLDVTRVTTGQIVLQRRPVDLAESISACLAALNAAKRLDGYELRVHVAPIWLDADPARLEQIIMNLLLNAISTAPGGRIDSRAAGGALGVLTVEDSGSASPPTCCPDLRPFVQGQREPDPRRRPGGRPTVRRLTDLHGGRVEAASGGPGRGSVFTVRLPLAAAPPAMATSLGQSTTSPVPRRVLMIEDYADARDSLRALLELSGHEVREAADGPTGVELALRLQPDVVLIDIGLPGLDGYDVARRIRSAPHGHRIVLAAVTGYGQPEDRRRAAEAGFDAFVKPVDPDHSRSSSPRRA